MKKCLSKDPEAIVVLYDLGVIHLAIGKYEEAIKLLERLVKAYPDHAAAYYYLGMAFNNLERYHEALYNFNKALKFNPEDHRARKMIDSISEFTRYPEGPI